MFENGLHVQTHASPHLSVPKRVSDNGWMEHTSTSPQLTIPDQVFENEFNPKP